ncbi:MAG: sulfoxide reductase heme-binding subunit YedZ, partial [Chromatiales bacterium]|nr:sulfoxide reductase heme-binding subunit YedZ [Chromatiales bacterium]
MTRAQIVTRIVKPLLFIACLTPVMLWPFIDLGANPIEKLTHDSGQWALRFLLITLAITPLQKLTGIGELVRLRRMLGLYAFFYALAHASVYFILDQGLDFSAVIADVVERPYITIGFAVFVSLIPLAVTSTNGMIKRLGGKRWKRLHRLVYFSAIGGVLHCIWLVKADLREPLIYLAILMLLLAFRAVPAILRARVSRVSAA